MAASMNSKLVENTSQILTLTNNLEDFLSAECSSSSHYTDPLKNLYDISKTLCQDTASSQALPELVVSGFDDEQVWQQLELENESCFSNLLHATAKIIANKKLCSFKSNKQTSQTIADKTKREKKQVQIDSQNKKKSQENKKTTPFSKKGSQQTVNDDVEDLLDESEEEDDDDDIDKVEKDLDDFDKDNKFFDFTGDSDEDLNFDFGPLGQANDLDEEIFKDDDSDSENKGGKSKNKKTKSVRFEDEIEKEKNFADNKRDSKNKLKKSSLKGSIVDDKFFKLADLEEFLDKEDRKEERRIRKEKKEADNVDDDKEDDENEDVDMFGEIQSDEEDAHYEDFFDPPDGEEDGTAAKKRRSNTEDNEDENFLGEDDENDAEEEEGLENEMSTVRRGQDLLADSGSEGEDLEDILGRKKKGDKSSYEMRQDKLKKKISAIEDGMLAEKPWQLSGEISAGKRPENSLLQESLQFEHTTRLPPEITEETTKTVEEIIRQRIKDKAWDDVERKVKPTENPFEYKKRVTLDQEKSKLSLSQIYEEEYLKQQKTEDEEKTDPDHDAIQNMMQSLFMKLDALSNFHYTPKQASAEITVVTNQPSISIEEVAPVSVSDGQLLAPEEIQNKEHHEVKGSTEKTKSDRLIERKQKKKNQRLRQMEREKKEKLVDKLNPGLGNKYSKEKALKKLENQSKADSSGVTLIKEDRKDKSNLTSSKTFFTQLQEEVTADISRKRQNKNKPDTKNFRGGKKFKL